MKISRRALLETTALSGTLISFRKAAAAIGRGVAVPGIGGGGGGGLPALTAEVTFPGGVPTASTVVFDISNGTDMGSYVAPTAGFTQRCIRCRNALIPNFFVDFRPDAAGGRIEAVFWNGEALGTVPSGTKRGLAAYNAVVKNAGTPIADFLGVTTRAIAFHDWGTRWRFQSAVRSIIRTAAQVFSQGWLPNMSAQAARVSGTNVSTGQAWSGLSYTDVPSGGSRIVPIPPGGTSNGFNGTIPSPTTNDGVNGDGSAMLMTSPYAAGGCVYQPFMKTDTSGSGRILGIESAGDNGGTAPHKFLITAWQGDWLIRGTATSLNTMMQHAEYFSGQAQSGFLPDQVVGGPINQKSDVTHYKTAIGVGNGIGYYDLKQGNTNNTIYYAAKGDEHSPQVFYLPWVLTEDAYYTEGQQYWESFATMANAYHKGTAEVGNLNSDPTGQTGVNGAFTLYPNPGGEERTIGWAVKNVAQAWVMSPASPPSWLLPKSYWAAVSSDYSAVIKRGRDSRPTDQYYTVFHSIDPYPLSSDTPQTFYKAYAAACFGFADLAGLPVPAAAGKPAPPSWFTQLDYLFDWFRNTADPATSSGWNVQDPILHDLGAPPFYMTSTAGASSGCVATLPGHQIPATEINCVTTYAQLWTAAFPWLEQDASGNPIGKYPSNPTPGYQGLNNGNLTLVYCAAAIAKSRGISGATAVFNFITEMIDYSFPQSLQSVHQFAVQDGFDGT